MIKNILLTIFILLIVVFAVTCAYTSYHEQLIEDGEVYNKNYEPECTWTQMLLMYSGTTPIMIPMIFHDDEDWTISIRKINEQGKELTRTLYIPKEMYNEYNIGDYFCISPNCSDEDDIESERQ